ncbi:MAG: thioredoxin family protein [Saprospiraceae bacterium]
MKKIFVFAFLYTLSLGIFAQETFNDNNFNSIVENTSKLIVMDFYADWCGPCKRMHPIVESLANKYAGLVIIGRLNTDYNDADDQLGITGLPTFLFIKNNRIVHKIVGAVSEKTLTEWIDYYK